MVSNDDTGGAYGSSEAHIVNPSLISYALDNLVMKLSTE